MSPYIESLGTVTCLVTSPIFVEVLPQYLWKLVSSDITSIMAIEVRTFNLIFYNCHWKLSTCEKVMAINKDLVLISEFHVV